MPASHPPFFSIGTQVVTLTDLHGAAGNTRLAGAVGIVVAAPAEAGDNYTVRFADGGEAALSHEALQVRKAYQRDGLDLVAKFCALLLKRNGYVLEQLLSPLVVQTTPAHAELCALAPQLVTRHHSHHYLGFAATQWGLFEKEQPRRVKPLLYVYRVLLTGIYLMQTGEVEANLPRLNERFRLPYLPELIARKLAGPEHGALADADVAFHRAEYERLRAALEEAHHASVLPETPAGRAALNDLLVRVRLDGPSGRGER